MLPGLAMMIRTHGRTEFGRNRCKERRNNAALVVALLVLVIGETGCSSHIATRRIVIPDGGWPDGRPDAMSCAHGCAAKRLADPRGAARCLDQCPGSWSVPGDDCENAPPGSACYVLVTETLTPDPKQIEAAFRIAGAVAEAAAEAGDEDEDDDEEGGYAERRDRSERKGARPSAKKAPERKAAKPKKKRSKPRFRMKRRELRRE